MILLRNLLEVVAILNPEMLNFNLTENLDPISYLANFEFSVDVAKNLAENFLDANSMSLNFDKNLIFRLKNLRNLLCGFPEDFIETFVRFNLKFGTFWGLLKVRGSFKLIVIEVTDVTIMKAR